MGKLLEYHDLICDWMPIGPGTVIETPCATIRVLREVAGRGPKVDDLGEWWVRIEGSLLGYRNVPSRRGPEFFEGLMLMGAKITKASNT